MEVRCNTKDKKCSTFLQKLNYPVSRENVITFINFDKKNTLKYPLTFTYSGLISNTESLQKYFSEMKKGNYLIDSISQKLGKEKYKHVKMLNYASFGKIFDLDKDKILLFYNSEKCKKCNDLIKNMDKTLRFLSKNGFRQIFGGYFDITKNSIFGLELEGKEDSLRFYKRGFKDMDDYSEVGIENVFSFEDILSFVMDMSSEHINVDFEEDL